MALQESRLEIREFGDMNFEPKAKKLKPEISDDGKFIFMTHHFTPTPSLELKQFKTLLTGKTRAI